MPAVKLFQVPEDMTGRRVDILLSEKNPELSRSHIQKLIAEEMLTVNDQVVRANYRVKAGDRVVLTLPPPKKLSVEPENIPLDIYYQDKDLIVVNKPRGMVVHPAEGNYSGTLVNALLYHCRDLSGVNGILRPGIVHRLDKDTSGLLMVAKNDTSHRELARQLKERLVTRRYLALVHGNLKEDTGTVDAPIGRHPRDRQRMAVVANGRKAVTHYQVRRRFGQYTLLEMRLETGRTHQIRVHMTYLGHPLVGDLKYGPEKPHFGLQGQFLHAYLLGFTHPRTKEYREFCAPLPAVLQEVLKQLMSKTLP